MKNSNERREKKEWYFPKLFFTLIISFAATYFAGIALEEREKKKAYEKFYSLPYITFEADNTQVFRLSNEISNLEYSVGESEWTKLGTQNIVFGGSRGKLLLRGTNKWGTSRRYINHHGGEFRIWSTVSFATDAQVICSGDIRTLIDYLNYNTVSTKEARFQKLFENCTQLVVAPELHATNLADKCYESMFSGCTSLKTAPDLPADTLSEECYKLMFSGCTSLERIPDLPAKILAFGCYEKMFSGCTSIKEVPDVLRVTDLVSRCYWGMFSNCTSLEIVDDLPAEILANGCYSEMFSGCTSLSQITMMATDINDKSCLDDWLKCTAQTGTFGKNKNATWKNDGIIPHGWKVNLIDP
jgi:hypothetical protein